MAEVIRFHLDENVNPAIARGLRQRGIDVTTSQEAGLLGVSDLEQLTYARREGRIIFTEDADFLILAAHTSDHNGITLKTDEFTCVCPMIGQPDFARLTVRYIPDQRIVESKSFKLYLWSYRNEGVFHEHVTNLILDDLVQALAPRWCEVAAEFSVRGGIAQSRQSTGSLEPMDSSSRTQLRWVLLTFARIQR